MMRPQSRIPRQIRELRKEKSVSVTELVRHRSVFPILDSKGAWNHLADWFRKQNWQPFAYQTEAWRRYLDGESGLICIPTGGGKTMAAFGGPLLQSISEPQAGLSVLYISPLKALARDVTTNLRAALEGLQLPLEVEMRTGDTSAKLKALLRKRLPHILVTTPESLALLLTDPEWQNRFCQVRAIIVDEWHELVGTKRGSLLELTLARLRRCGVQARTWVLSATLADVESAAQTAIGPQRPHCLIQVESSRAVEIESILPPDVTAFTWFGHLGLQNVPLVLADIDPQQTTLIFTNTRSQAERWYQEISRQRPDWQGSMALHHGSLEGAERESVEAAVKNGDLKLVVATSSLDLGVDFPLVEKVIQIGSAKGFARAQQRAGRAFHRPFASTRFTMVPTNLLEILEISAVREGLKSGQVEQRQTLGQPLDVFVQFLLNSAFEEGFTRQEVLEICRDTVTFQSIGEKEIDWALEFLTRGGFTLQAYPDFQKLIKVGDRYVFANRRLAFLHRMNIGTIVADAGVQVRFMGGRSLGSIEEKFIAKLKIGQAFFFAGKALKLVAIKDMQAIVKRAGPHDKAIMAVWNGTQLPITRNLSQFIRAEVARLAVSVEEIPRLETSPELNAFRPAAIIQAERSYIPNADEILIEVWNSRRAFHLFVYPFEGKSVHEGLGHLMAYRLSRHHRASYAISANDHGFELVSSEAPPPHEEIIEALISSENLDIDIEASLNYPELARREFREIARIAGLIHTGNPSRRKTVRHLQMGSGLLFDVLRRYEPDHPLVAQAFQQVRENHLELTRLRDLQLRMKGGRVVIRNIQKLTPFAFPLVVEDMKSHLSSEKLRERLARLQKASL